VFRTITKRIRRYLGAPEKPVENPQESLRKLVPAFIGAGQVDMRDRDVYEFGVYGGDSMRFIADVFERHGVRIRKMFGFDSLEGLPPEKDDPYLDEEWIPGSFNASELFQTKNTKEIVNRIRTKIGSRSFDIVIVPGFWDSVLENGLVKKYDMRAASYIDIDCDLYSSTYLALDFMFRNKLAAVDSLIGYDDWGGTLVFADEGKGGESRAHEEIKEKYKVTYQLLQKLGVPPHVKTLFKIESIG
jgi:hypothetical protein